MNLFGEMQQKCKLEKHDHEILQIEMDWECEETRLGNHKEKRRNYNKAKHNYLWAFFGSINWSEMKKLRKGILNIWLIP